MIDRVAISKVKNDEIEAAVRDAVSLAGGLKDIVKPDSKVLVKPNVCKPAASGSGVLTSAAVTEAVTRMVLDLGPQSVVIGDGAIAGYDFGGFSTQEAFEASGTSQVARRLGVELRNLNSDKYEEVAVENALAMDKVRIARTALESDVIISVPVLKTHIRSHVTLSLKNMKGVMPGVEKRKSHRVGLDMAIVDLNSVVRPAYAVVDATMAMEGLWQYPQDCRPMGLVLAGRNPLTVDVVGAYLMGIDPAEVMHLQYLAEREGASLDPDKIEVAGEQPQQYRQQFKLGFQVFEERYPEVNVIRGESACSGCTNELVSAVTYMKEAGYGPAMKDLNVIIGEPGEVDVGEKTAAVGKCARGFSHLGGFAPGCPPKEDEIIRALCEVCAADTDRVLATRDESRRKLWEKSAEALKS